MKHLRAKKIYLHFYVIYTFSTKHLPQCDINKVPYLFNMKANVEKAFKVIAKNFFGKSQILLVKKIKSIY